MSTADLAHRRRRAARRAGTAAGGFFLAMAGIHVGIVAAAAETYRPFADAAHLDLVRDLWRDVFMAEPQVWGLAVALGEAVIGVLLLSGGRAAVAGYVAAICFHLALMLFGWGIWLWCLPALGVLLVLLRRHTAGGWAAALSDRRYGGAPAAPTRRPSPER